MHKRKKIVPWEQDPTRYFVECVCGWSKDRRSVRRCKTDYYKHVRGIS